MGIFGWGSKPSKDPDEIARVQAAMVARLVTDYHASRVIRIAPSEDDPKDAHKLDFLVIADTQDPFEVRRDGVLALLREVDKTQPVDVLVLTPKEVEHRVKKGDYLLSEMMRYGETLYPAAEE